MIFVDPWMRSPLEDITILSLALMTSHKIHGFTLWVPYMKPHLE
jgi:hypothetical protein